VPRPHLHSALLIASLVAILAFTLVPLDADNELELVPLRDVVEAVGSSDAMRVLELLVESAANVLLFTPLGIALGLRGVSTTKTAVLVLALSAAVEAAQLLVVPGRTTSVDDVVLNTLGAVLGHLLLALRKPTAAPAPPPEGDVRP
jgi:glycopeptide antibiotics resistance protein